MATRSFNNAYILRISFVSALGGYLFGFDFAVISGALPFLRPQFGLSPIMEGFLTGCLALGCIVGCPLAGNISERYGRRPGLIAAALIFALSSLGMAFSPSLDIFLWMRFSAGIGVGMASMLSPMYIAEVSPPDVRGRNIAINQLNIVMGVLVTNIVNYFLAAKGADSWRWMFGLGFIPSSLFFFGVLWLPESPRWLAGAGRTAEAKKVLTRIGDTGFAEETLHDILRSIKNAGRASYKDVFRPAVRPAVLIGIGLAVFQQLCGINIVFNYTSTIFASVGASLDRQLIETVGIGIVNLVFTLLAMWQVDKWGRRPLMLAGSLGLCILYIGLSLALQEKWSTGLVSAFVLLSIGAYASSLAPVTWILIAEIFPNKIRSMASSVAVVSLWIAYFVLVFTFPILAEKLGTYGPFYFYSGICLLGFLFVKMKLKETKGRTLEEMEDRMIAH